MEELCLDWDLKDSGDRMRFLHENWDTLPDTIRRIAYRRVCQQQEAECCATLEYDAAVHGRYEDYLRSNDYAMWLSQARATLGIYGHGFSHSQNYVPPDITCEGCLSDYPMGHPSQHYHQGEGGCLCEKDENK